MLAADSLQVATETRSLEKSLIGECGTQVWNAVLASQYCQLRWRKSACPKLAANFCEQLRADGSCGSCNSKYFVDGLEYHPKHAVDVEKS